MMSGRSARWGCCVGLLLLASTAASSAAQVSDTSAVDQDLLRDLEREMAASDSAPSPPTRSRPSLNPDISVIGDLRASWTSEGPRNVGLGVDEVETAFRSVIDPYARADVYFSVGEHDGHMEFELEEAYVTSLSLPAGLQARMGRFRSNFGRINRTHPHALPFIDVPAVYENFFGGHGLNDQGVGLSWLVPNRRFYQELSVEITAGPHENASFEDAEDNRLLYTAHLRNFWDLSPSATLELGLSGIHGPNPAGETTRIAAVDLTYKWKPLRFNTYRSFTAQAEALWSRNDTGDGVVEAWGAYGLLAYQFARRWSVNARADVSDLPDDADWNQRGLTATVGWYLTEFQKLEWGLRRWTASGMDPQYAGLFRLVFVIGTHGAHEY